MPTLEYQSKAELDQEYDEISAVHDKWADLKSEVVEAERGSKTAQADFEQARADVAAARTELKVAERELHAYESAHRDQLFTAPS